MAPGTAGHLKTDAILQRAGALLPQPFAPDPTGLRHAPGEQCLAAR